MFVQTQQTPKGTVLIITLEDKDWIQMGKRNDKGEPYFIGSAPPLGPTLVSGISLTRILKSEVDTVLKKGKILAEDRKRAERYRKLSPCCGAKMLHEDEDPEDVMTCTQCLKKHKTPAPAPSPPSGGMGG